MKIIIGMKLKNGGEVIDIGNAPVSTIYGDYRDWDEAKRTGEWCKVVRVKFPEGYVNFSLEAFNKLK